MLAVADYAASLLGNGLARYEAAVDAAQRGTDYEDQGYVAWPLVELVESATRRGRRDAATRVHVHDR